VLTARKRSGIARHPDRPPPAGGNIASATGNGCGREGGVMENGQIARGVYEELFSKGKLDFVDKNFDRSFQGHDTLLGDYGYDRLKSNVQMYRSAFPDLSIRVDDVVETAEKVLIRWTARGTQRGTFLGRSATNKQSSVQGISVHTFKNGKIIEDFAQWDALKLLRDLGFTPELEQLGSQQPSA
jgi:steroid delta-isomerase-like uncharacterized protein